MEKSHLNNIQDLAEKIAIAASSKQRYIFSISGAPGSGKSTLANNLKKLLKKKHSTSCQIIAMDGFHLDNRILQEQELLTKKGSPNTFDLASFDLFLTSIKLNKSTLFAPIFDRNIDAVIENAVEIHTNTRIILVEGNYLLLENSGWQDLAQHFDNSVFLDVPINKLRRRLINRWLKQNYDENAATTKVDDNDMPNALQVIDQSSPADFILKL